MFVQNHAHQSDAGRLRHRRRSRIVAGGLSVPRYQVQTQSCRGRGGFERLRKMQQCVQIGRDVGAIDQVHRDSKDRRCAQVRSPHSSSTSCCQSSSASGRKVKASVPSNSKWSPVRGDAASGAKFAKSRNQPFTHSRGIGENEP